MLPDATAVIVAATGAMKMILQSVKPIMSSCDNHGNMRTSSNSLLHYMCAMWKRSFFSIMSCSNSICVLTRSILVLRSVAVPVGIHEVMKCTAEEIVLDKNMGKLPTLSDRMTHGAMHVISKQTILQRFLWFETVFSWRLFGLGSKWCPHDKIAFSWFCLIV